MRGEIVGEGYHQKVGGPHAEIHALQSANEKAAGGTLYVNLEPLLPLGTNTSVYRCAYPSRNRTCLCCTSGP